MHHYGRPDLTWFFRALPRPLRAVVRGVVPGAIFTRYFTRHERGSLHLWASLCERVAPGDAILDIGAFHGEYALLAKRTRPEAFVCAFEPGLEALPVLRALCDPEGIEVVSAAVGRSEGEALFRDHPDGPCSTVVARADDATTRSPAGIRSVPMVSVDGWRRQRGVAVALVKIDVEGAETDVVLGAADTLQHCRPTILCEILSDQAGAAVMVALSSSYRYFAIDELEGARLSPVVRRTSFRNRNWLFWPDPASDPPAVSTHKGLAG